MSKDNAEPLAKLLSLLFKAHPWHGVSIGNDAPEVVTTYIEIVPTDTVKYELDKTTGILKIDRPQRFSNVCPAPAWSLSMSQRSPTASAIAPTPPRRVRRFSIASAMIGSFLPQFLFAPAGTLLHQPGLTTPFRFKFPRSGREDQLNLGVLLR